MTATTKGQGTKQCSAGASSNSTSHYYHYVAKPTLLNGLLRAPSPNHAANEEVFRRTLAFYCALTDQGCAFGSDTNSDDGALSEPDSDISDSQEIDRDDSIHDSRRRLRAHCKGLPILAVDKYDRPIVQ